MRQLKSAEEYRELKEREGWVLLQYTSAACGPCASLRVRIEDWQREHPQVETAGVPIEHLAECAAQDGIFTVPAIAIWYSGRCLLQESGYFSLDRLLAKLQRLLQMEGTDG